MGKSASFIVLLAVGLAWGEAVCAKGPGIRIKEIIVLKSVKATKGAGIVEKESSKPARIGKSKVTRSSGKMPGRTDRSGSGRWKIEEGYFTRLYRSAKLRDRIGAADIGSPKAKREALREEISRFLLPAMKQDVSMAIELFERGVLSLDISTDWYTVGAAVVRSLFKNVSLTEVDILVFYVLTEALKDLEKDIAIIKADSRSAYQAEQKLGHYLEELDKHFHRAARPTQIADQRQGNSRILHMLSPEIGKLRLTWATTPHYKVPYLKVVENMDAEPREEKETLRSFRDYLKKKLDSLIEMSEQTSWWLKETMKRRSKFIKTLSNIMERISGTEESLSQIYQIDSEVVLSSWAGIPYSGAGGDDIKSGLFSQSLCFS